ncbi:hypothetical protein AXF42_Ash002728 [Apostasia shenzhenica]|uniref:Uncharacterized protein n=1 Tax=Apostasia shenzhenica TaxID=1088818 RepID=A0A2I0A740_9ASPA|nr:hypothetical protein AXF42_Ash002728 [Apostasia shenzhenica]
MSTCPAGASSCGDNDENSKEVAVVGGKPETGNNGELQNETGDEQRKCGELNAMLAPSDYA